MTTTQNELISVGDYEKLDGVKGGSRRDTPEMKALKSLMPGHAIIFVDHGTYKHKKSCGFATMAMRIIRQRGLLCSVKHLPDKRIAVAVYPNGK